MATLGITGYKLSVALATKVAMSVGVTRMERQAELENDFWNATAFSSSAVSAEETGHGISED